MRFNILKINYNYKVYIGYVSHMLYLGSMGSVIVIDCSTIYYTIISAHILTREMRRYEISVP